MYIIIYYLDTVQIINICIMMYYVYIKLYTVYMCLLNCFPEDGNIDKIEN